MDVEDKIKRRIQKWKHWDSQWSVGNSVTGRIAGPKGRITTINNSIYARQRKLTELVRNVIADAHSLTQNPPAKVTSFNGYDNTPTKKNRGH